MKPDFGLGSGNSAGGLSPGAKGGIIGGVLGAVVLIFAFIILYLVVRKREIREDTRNQDTAQVATFYDGVQVGGGLKYPMSMGESTNVGGRLRENMVQGGRLNEDNM